MSARPVLRPPGRLTLDDRPYRVRNWRAVVTCLPYSDWQTPFLLTTLRARDAEALAVRLYDPDDPFDTPDAAGIAEQLVSAATGWPWYSAQRLAGTAVADWATISGLLAAEAGLDLAELVARRPATALNAVYALLVRNVEPVRRMQIVAELDAPPPGQRPQGWTDEEEGALFLKAMAEG